MSGKDGRQSYQAQRASIGKVKGDALQFIGVVFQSIGVVHHNPFVLVKHRPVRGVLEEVLHKRRDICWRLLADGSEMTWGAVGERVGRIRLTALRVARVTVTLRVEGSQVLQSRRP